jgi:hypothetical protein
MTDDVVPSGDIGPNFFSYFPGGQWAMRTAAHHKAYLPLRYTSFIEFTKYVRDDRGGRCRPTQIINDNDGTAATPGEVNQTRRSDGMGKGFGNLGFL